MRARGLRSVTDLRSQPRAARGAGKPESFVGFDNLGASEGGGGGVGFKGSQGGLGRFGRRLVWGLGGVGGLEFRCPGLGQVEGFWKEWRSVPYREWRPWSKSELGSQEQ